MKMEPRILHYVQDDRAKEVGKGYFQGRSFDCAGREAACFAQDDNFLGMMLLPAWTTISREIQKGRIEEKWQRPTTITMLTFP
jgi:hypothetical protein